MQFVTLRQSLTQKVQPAYLLFGSDIFLINKSIELIEKALDTTEVTRFDETATLSQITAAAQTFSMFSSKRLIVVRNISDSSLKELKKYLDNPNPDTTLVLVINSEKAPTFKLGIQTVDCSPIQGDILLKLIAKQVGDSGKQITANAATLLAGYCSNNYSKINNELNKLLNLTEDKVLDIRHIEGNVTPNEDYQIFELGNAIAKQDIFKADRILAHMQQSGVEDYAIFGNLVGMYRRLYYALCSKATNDQVASVLKCNPYAVLYARRDNKHLLPKIKSIYKEALELEYKIKAGIVNVTSGIQILKMAGMC